MPLAVLGAALAGCASNAPVTAPPSAAAGTIINAPRSDRGNPPFYEVFGERYYVLDTSDGYRERGVASWYGPNFHGKQTSGGEVYDMHAMTAAHKTLPIPTWVEVTNLSNGKRVIVKVNDRGPFVDDRIIDLSYSAAQALDMIKMGTARVQVRALGAPAAEPVLPVPVQASAPEPARRGFSIISEAEAGTPRPGDAAFRPLYVQVGAFAEQQNAQSLVSRLKQGGFSNSFVVSTGQGSTRIHRVRIGPLGNADEFDRIRNDLRAVGVFESRLVVDN
jgi:rare lipoprotein A